MMLRDFARKSGLIGLSIVLLGSFILFPVSTAHAEMDGDFEYTDLGDGTATIIGYTGPNGGNVTIPDRVGDDLTVVEIGSNAFEDKQLTELTLPSSITTIEPYAFWNNQLTALVIPNSVTTIGGGAFQFNQLTELTLPSSITEIQQTAFLSNQLTELEIPDSVTAIETGAFRNNALEDVVILNQNADFEDAVFDDNPDTLTLYGHDPSTSNTFAADNGIDFQAITAELENLQLNLSGWTFNPVERDFDLMTNALSVIVTPTAVVPFSEVKVNGVMVPYGESSLPIALDEVAETITVDVTAPDNTEERYTVELGVDRISPSVQLTANPNTPTNGNVTVTVDAIDADSGISELKWGGRR